MITIKELEEKREERGLEIVRRKESQVTRIEETLYTVHSQSGNGEYAVSQVDKEWVCECPDNKFRNVKCKHILQLSFLSR